MLNLRTSEKSVRLIELENTLTVETERKARKEDIKKQVEEMFKVKIAKIRTQIKDNKKIAYIKLAPESQAIDIATKFGMI